MSHSQELVQTIYEEEVETLNGHNGDVPPTQTDRPQIEGELGTRQDGIVEN